MRIYETDYFHWLVVYGILWILFVWIAGMIVLSCAQLNSNDQLNADSASKKQAACIKLANDCFEGMYRLQEDRGTLDSMAQSCLWSWQSWKCYELGVHENVNRGIE